MLNAKQKGLMTVKYLFLQHPINIGWENNNNGEYENMKLCFFGYIIIIYTKYFNE